MGGLGYIQTVGMMASSPSPPPPTSGHLIYPPPSPLFRKQIALHDSTLVWPYAQRETKVFKNMRLVCILFFYCSKDKTQEAKKCPSCTVQSAQNLGCQAFSLKVPKCENFHRTDFSYFYTIKPLWVGDFRAKIKNSKILYLGGLFEVSFSKIMCQRRLSVRKKKNFSSQGKKFMCLCLHLN